MRISHFRLHWLLGLSVVIGLVGCKDKNPPKEYDRGALVANIGDRIVTQAYDDLVASSTALQVQQRAFRTTPNATTLSVLQAAFKAAWLDWKACSPFEFGPAATASLRAVMNTFPTDSVQILGNVAAGTWDLNQAANLDARGFPALDYLLFGTGSDSTAVLARFTQAADSMKLQAYLAAVVLDVETQAANIRSEWANGYLATFKASLGTDVGSSTSFLVNQLTLDLELVKNASLGIPMGKETFGTLLPDKAEAYYSGISMQLIQHSLLALEAIYNGEYAFQSTPGYGLKEALAALEAEYNGESLAETISEQFAITLNKAYAVPDPLSGALTTHSTELNALYTEIQKLVVLLKTDMASALSILITYSDADGD